MTGDDLANRVARAMLAAEGTGPAWGIELEEARENYARVSMLVRPDMLNGHGMAHGGMIFALLLNSVVYMGLALVAGGSTIKRRRRSRQAFANSR